MRITIPLCCSLLLVSLLFSPSIQANPCGEDASQNLVGERGSGATRPLLIAAGDSDQSDVYEQAEAAFREKNYGEVIRLLSGPANAEPGNFKINILLAKAEVEECERLKGEGNPAWKTLVFNPYNRGRRLHAIDKTRPEPYCVVARALIINNRPDKALRVIRKGLYFAPNNPEYLMVMGDAYKAKAEKERWSSSDVRRWLSDAEDAYKKALTAASEEAGELKEEIERRLRELSE